MIEAVVAFGVLLAIARGSGLFLARLLTACYGAPGPGANWSVAVTALGCMVLVIVASPLAAWASYVFVRGRTTAEAARVVAAIVGAAAAPALLVPLLFLLMNPPAPLACAAAYVSAGGPPDTIVVIRENETIEATIWSTHEEAKPRNATQEDALEGACRGSADAHVFLQVPAVWTAPDGLPDDCTPSLHIMRRSH